MTKFSDMLEMEEELRKQGEIEFNANTIRSSKEMLLDQLEEINKDAMREANCAGYYSMRACGVTK